MKTILVPYHHDDRLPATAIAVPADSIVEPDLPEGDRRQRMAGLQRAGADPAIVWLDAHGDVHTLDTSTSGYLGGMSLRLVTGTHPDLYATPIGLRPVPGERAVLVDARDLDPAEAAYLATSATRRIPVTRVDPATVRDGPLVLHLDVACTWSPASGEHDSRRQLLSRILAW